MSPFSLFCIIEYLLQLRSGRSLTTAPVHALNGGRELPWCRLHAIWNCSVLDVLLPQIVPQPCTRHATAAAEAAALGHEDVPPKDTPPRLYWISPTAGRGYIQLRYLLRLSVPWVRELWQSGYEHCRQLDEDGYFEGLPRRGGEPAVVSSTL